MGDTKTTTPDLKSDKNSFSQKNKNILLKSWRAIGWIKPASNCGPNWSQTFCDKTKKKLFSCAKMNFKPFLVTILTLQMFISKSFGIFLPELFRGWISHTEEGCDGVCQLSLTCWFSGGRTSLDGDCNSMFKVCPPSFIAPL